MYLEIDLHKKLKSGDSCIKFVKKLICYYIVKLHVMTVDKFTGPSSQEVINSQLIND